jgi:GTP-binding protein
MKISLVWSANAGKSTLFNRLVGQFRTIVTDIPGTTVDIVTEKTHIDQLGNVIVQDSPWLMSFEEEIPYLTKNITTGNVILFVIDWKKEFTSKEEFIKNLIIQNNKKSSTIIVVNKLDKAVYDWRYHQFCADFWALWFEYVVGISAKSGYNIEELIYTIKLIKESQQPIKKIKEKNIELKCAIVGKPNAGKSTLLNYFAGEDISKVSEVSWTTRDYLIAETDYNGLSVRFFDTSWVRKFTKMLPLEKIAYEKTLTMLKFVRPFVIFLIDGVESITHRDMTLIQEINKFHLPVIIWVNKIDLLDDKTIKWVLQTIKNFLNFASYIEIVPLSWKRWDNVKKLFDKIKKSVKRINQRIPTSELNKIISRAYIQNPPRFPKNKVCKIYYGSQVDNNPPHFVFFINDNKKANFAFIKWIENVIRKNYDFTNIPIKISFKDKQQQSEQTAQTQQTNEQ